MTTTLTQCVCLSFAIGISYGQGSVSGTVRDDTGAVPFGSSVQIVQIVPFANRMVVPTGDAVNTRPPAPYTGTSVVDSTGAYTISGVPSGTYMLCAYSSNQRLL